MQEFLKWANTYPAAILIYGLLLLFVGSLAKGFVATWMYKAQYRSYRARAQRDGLGEVFDELMAYCLYGDDREKGHRAAATVYFRVRAENPRPGKVLPFIKR
jgi:hypothetical protein